MQGYIDIHNHTLPNIDDGAKSIAMAVEMLKVAEQNHTKEIILTPHHLNGAFLNSAITIKQHFNELQKEVTREKINIKLHLGSEIHLTPETVEQVLSGDAMSICDHKKAVLIELPKNSIPFGAETILSKLLHNDITPIIVHPERNTALRNDSTPLKEWVNMGCKTQLTAMSCTGEFGTDIQKISLQLIADTLVHFIASDTHRPVGRSPNLNPAAEFIKETFNEEISAQLFYENPKRLTMGEVILDIPMTILKQKTKRKKWFRLKKNS